MKIEPGKYYRTRDGKKAYVGHILPEEIAEGNSYLVRGYLLKERGWCNESWSIEGIFSVNEPNHHFNLVAEWTEGPNEVVLVDYSCVKGGYIVREGHEFFRSTEAAHKFIVGITKDYDIVDHKTKKFYRSND